MNWWTSWWRADRRRHDRAGADPAPGQGGEGSGRRRPGAQDRSPKKSRHEEVQALGQEARQALLRLRTARPCRRAPEAHPAREGDAGERRRRRYAAAGPGRSRCRGASPRRPRLRTRGQPQAAGRAGLARWHRAKGRRWAQTRPAARARNTAISRKRSRVEHVFGQFHHLGRKLVRAVNLARNELAIVPRCVVHDARRLVWLEANAVAAEIGKAEVRPQRPAVAADTRNSHETSAGGASQLQLRPD